jgi:hypothetical protein
VFNALFSFDFIVYLGADCAPKTPNQYFSFLKKEKYWRKEKTDAPIVRRTL